MVLNAEFYVIGIETKVGRLNTDSGIIDTDG